MGPCSLGRVSLISRYLPLRSALCFPDDRIFPVSIPFYFFPLTFLAGFARQPSPRCWREHFLFSAFEETGFFCDLPGRRYRSSSCPFRSFRRFSFEFGDTPNNTRTSTTSPRRTPPS